MATISEMQCDPMFNRQQGYSVTKMIQKDLLFYLKFLTKKSVIKKQLKYSELQKQLLKLF